MVYFDKSGKGLIVAIDRVSSFCFIPEETMRDTLQRYKERRERIFYNPKLNARMNTRDHIEA